MVIVCFGPGPAFKGGIANYNTSLAKAFDALSDTEVHIVSWTQQYPAIIPREFKDHASKKDQLAGTQIKAHYLTNYNNPISWGKTVSLIKSLNTDLVIIQWSIAIQGLPLGRIISGLKKAGIKTVLDLHFVVQKENSTLDKYFTKMALSKADNFVTHARKTFDELSSLFSDRQFRFIDRDEQWSENKYLENKTIVINLFHPVYDMFRPDPDFDKEAYKLNHGLKKHVFLFFGFIRKYKGLHNVIPAFKQLSERRDDVSLLICGESFWHTLDNKKLSTKIKSALFKSAKKLFLKQSDDEREYNPLDLIDSLGINNKVTVVNEFIPNEDVHKYFQVSDAVLLFYEYATPSGVESIGYNFNMPILATSVGHFPETVRPGYNGYLAKPDDINSMTDIMEEMIRNPISRQNVAETSKDMSWSNYAQRIVDILM